jgi:hypothetical protein
MGRVEQYLKSAQECEGWARSAQAEYERKDFLDIAKAFRQAAAQLTASTRRSRVVPADRRESGAAGSP